MGIRDHLQKQREQSRSRGGPRTEFYRCTRGAQTVRLLMAKVGGELGPDYVFYQHRLGPRESVACPTTFDPDAPCDHCEESREAYKAGDNKRGTALMAKEYRFFLVAPVDGKEHTPHVLQLPYGAARKLWLNIAMRGGWANTEIDWEDEEFLTAAETGWEKVCGVKALDVVITYTPNAQANTYKFKFSKKQGKKLNLVGYDPEDPPDLENIFRMVKRVGRDTTSTGKPSAPPEDSNSRDVLEAMTKAQLIDLAKERGVTIRKSWGKAKLVDALLTD